MGTENARDIGLRKMRFSQEQICFEARATVIREKSKITGSELTK